MASNGGLDVSDYIWSWRFALLPSHPISQSFVKDGLELSPFGSRQLTHFLQKLGPSLGGEFLHGHDLS